jgi:glycosyltransferase involved in cell wall biosynthesis
MHGGAITLADELLEQREPFSAILASDMLDLPLFLSRIRSRYPSISAGIYFHENQAAYPWSPRDGDKKRGLDLHYSFLNYTSALVADAVFFNSDFHRQRFLSDLPDFLKRYPDYQNLFTVDEIQSKSQTLWLGMDLTAFDEHRATNSGSESHRPLILWNHRWEYDKNPIGFFRILYRLLDDGIEFDLALAGDRFEEEPPYFQEAKERLGNRIVQYGKLSSFANYAELLWKSDIALVTSKQDFFGGSVVEAVYCGCHPILPRRLAYTDHLCPENHPEVFYNDEEEAINLVKQLVASDHWRRPFQQGRALSRYDWSSQIDAYDLVLARLCQTI